MSAERPRPDERPSTALVLVRYVIPAVVVVGGILAYLLNPSIIAAEGAAGVVGAGLAWFLFGWLFRKGVEGDSDRDAEDAARAYFDRHGRWPDDPTA
jgi:hypothetical protein